MPNQSMGWGSSKSFTNCFGSFLKKKIQGTKAWKCTHFLRGWNVQGRNEQGTNILNTPALSGMKRTGT
jgi:hypothetical protein